MLFDRADNVINVCEMKYTSRNIENSILDEMENKVEKKGYFYKIIHVDELLQD